MTQQIWAYFIIPVTSALVGWSTNWLAIKMMFYPLEFVGKAPYLGWRGIIPANAPRLARIAVRLLLDKLLSLEEIAARLDAQRMTAAMEQRLDQLLEEIISEIMRERAPRVWEMLPLWVKDKIYREAHKDAPETIAAIVDDVKANIREVFDIEQMMVDALVRDRGLLNELFQKAGNKEFAFLEKSGLYFGFLFGIPSMIIWVLYNAWWTLPAGGLVVGYATNWLAIKMIFEPQEPVKVGPITWQGLFLRRQQEVSAVYSKLVTEKILTADKIADTILRGPVSDRLFKIIERHVNRSIDASAGIAKPYILLGIGTQEYIDLKQNVFDKVKEKAPDTMQYTYAYADEALDIETTLRQNMQSLTPAEFEGVLRPAYQQDEWKLILVGGALGMVAGFMQLFLLR